MLKGLIQYRMRKLAEKRGAIAKQIKSINDEVDFYETEIQRWQTEKKKQHEELSKLLK